VFLASLLRGVVARLFPRSSRSPQKTPTAADVVVPVAPKRRPVQRRPMLWPVRSKKHPPDRVFCGPTATSALIGADVDEIMHLIQTHHGNDRPVEGTLPDELQHVLRKFGCDLQFVAYLAANNPPSLARWERERTGADFEKCLMPHRRQSLDRSARLVDMRLPIHEERADQD
jgi:hypothetical protein